MNDGVLTITLHIRAGNWYPEAEDGPHIRVYAFGEAGKTPSIPGPLIRVPEGTRIHASVINGVEVPMVVHGLDQKPGKDEAVILAPGESHVFDFPANSSGTYYYWAGLPDERMAREGRLYSDSTQLTGALIVDPATGSVADRVFVIGLWKKVDDRALLTNLRLFATINGKSWPYTERLHPRVGEEIRMRWLNVTDAVHPMHLHGGYYRVDSLGDGHSDAPLDPGKRRMVATELMNPGTTMDAVMKAERPGHWLLHCHLLAHVTEEEQNPYGSLSAMLHQNHDHRAAHSGMVGLVMALEVAGELAVKKAAVHEARQLRLVLQQSTTQPMQIRTEILESGKKTSRSEALMGPPVVLQRGEPVEITVVNQLAQETAIHWHGIELESYYDGVPGFSGNAKQVTPPIPPGGRFVARFTPPRSGTFIYHTHWHDHAQLAGGLYGPLIVVDGKYDPETDIPIVAGGHNHNLMINGREQPTVLALRTGKHCRLRLINIMLNTPVLFSLLDAGKTVRWRPVSKDGMELPPAQQNELPATQLVGTGETYDFEFTPQTSDLTLRAFRRSLGQVVDEAEVKVPIQVR